MVLSELGYINCSAAFAGAAFAGNPFDFFVEAIVDGQFFAALDGPEAHIDDVPPDNPRNEVRVAGMIDVFRAGTAGRTIECPVGVEGEKIGKFTLLGAASGLAPADFFAGIFDYLAIGRNGLAGVHAPAMNAGGASLSLKQARLGSMLVGPFSFTMPLPGSAFGRIFGMAAED